MSNSPHNLHTSTRRQPQKFQILNPKNTRSCSEPAQEKIHPIHPQPKQNHSSTSQNTSVAPTPTIKLDLNRHNPLKPKLTSSSPTKPGMQSTDLDHPSELFENIVAEINIESDSRYSEFSRISPIPSPGQKLSKNNSKSNIHPLTGQDGKKEVKQSILLIDNYELNQDQDEFFELEGRKEGVVVEEIRQVEDPDLSLISSSNEKAHQDPDIKEMLTQITPKEFGVEESCVEKRVIPVPRRTRGRDEELTKPKISLSRPSHSLHTIPKFQSLGTTRQNKSYMESSKEGILSDTEVERLEQLLDCKNRAVKKWIEEKEDHFDKMTQKLYSRAEKQLKKYKESKEEDKNGD